ncbi:MAG: hypothetical protein CXT73_04600 [Methanobacteriota archaeon]|nr:MAG: hypothetical protein CXT73_04600 [Euryarchaeota archaeon]
MIICNSLIVLLENVGSICEKIIINSIENIKNVTDDCLSTMNSTNLDKMKENKYKKVSVEKENIFNDEDIEIIWTSSDEWEELV